MGRLYRRQQRGNQAADDRDDNQQLDQRKTQLGCSAIHGNTAPPSLSKVTPRNAGKLKCHFDAFSLPRRIKKRKPSLPHPTIVRPGADRLLSAGAISGRKAAVGRPGHERQWHLLGVVL